MTFETKKFNEVFADMRQRTSVVTDFEVGSVVRTLYESFSYEIALLYEKMQLVYLSAYVDTATGEQLDKVVAVLGVKRGLPDFAEGEVTWQRDVGNLDITIPIGTLVATVDLPESPKKVYQTSEVKLFPKDQTTIAIQIQAVERGEQEVTNAETLVILPRPIPGIKSVINLETTRFTGKKRETDEELRQRAKNTLISSGKATLLSIENALLSLPGVKDVKVRENFRYARGEVTVNRGTATDEVVIPKDTQLIVTIPTLPPTLKPFKTTERMVLGEFSSAIAVPVQSLIEGRVGELPQTTGISWQILENDPLQNSLLVTNLTPLLLSDFGVIEVFVDCDKFDDPIVFQQLQDEIDRVRAAGIFVILKSAVTVNLDGVFQVDPSPDLKLTPADRSQLEQTVREEIIKYIENQQMGQPLLFAQIVKNVLSLNGINNLEEFQIVASKLRSDDISQLFSPVNKRIETDEFEKFNPRYLCVASEPKDLPIHLQFKLNELNETQQQTIATALSTYFKQLKPGVAVSKSAIAAQINAASGNALVSDTLTLIPQPWCQSAPVAEGAIETVSPSFVETARLGEIFAYRQDLQITGAIKLTLPASLTDKDKLNVRNQVRAGITRYITQLQPEADVVFADLIAIAAAINPVTAVDLTASDFQVTLDQQPTVGRVSSQKIEVQVFEKARLDHVCITSNIEPVQIMVTVALELVVTNPAPPGFDQEATIAALKTAIRTTINNFLSGTTPGQTIIYANFKTALENLIPAADYSIQQLSLSAVSSCDNRTQTTALDTATDLYIRSVEIANLQPISLEDVDITVKTVDLPPPPMT